MNEQENLSKVLNEIVPYALVGGAGIMGRLMLHAKMVQAGQRKPLSWALLWDLPIALGTGWAAYGITVYFNLAFPVSISASIIASYLGPYAIDQLFYKWSKLWSPFGGKADTTAAPPTGEV